MRIARFLLGSAVAMLLLPLLASLRAEEFPPAEKLAQLSIKAELVLAHNMSEAIEKNEKLQKMKAALPKIDKQLEKKLKSVFNYENYELLASPLLSVIHGCGAEIRLVENLELHIHPTIMDDGKTVVMELGLIERKPARLRQAMRRRARRGEGEERRLPREEMEGKAVGEPVETPVLATTLRMKDGSTVLLGGTKYRFGVLILAITAKIET